MLHHHAATTYLSVPCQKRLKAPVGMRLAQALVALSYNKPGPVQGSTPFVNANMKP